jgi:hypothetical protein
MKKFLGFLWVALLVAALAAFAQTTNPQTPRQGNGPGPHAYCDKNADGICDITGQPVGQCRGQNGECPRVDCPNQCPRGQGQGAGRGQGQGQGRGYRGGNSGQPAPK